MKPDDVNKRPAENLIALELHGVSKTFHSDSGTKVQALEGVNLLVRKGEFITLVGATGCGKTTLLNLIAGLDTPDNGYLSLGNGLRFGDNIAYVFQHYTLFPWRSALGNVAFGLQMRGVPRKQRKSRASDLLARVGLSGFENAYPNELSGGMRQRAAIAQALAIQPKLLLMDEPFGAVDDSTRSELQQMLTELWQGHLPTILFVTHNIDEAIVLGGRVLVFSERPGKIEREFKIDLPRPRNRMTKEFTNLFIQIRRSLSGQLD
jgi:ABC-type nitrate/sulfonate/bicarbonate transport system ATPase subunit